MTGDISPHMTDKPYKYNNGRFYKIVLPLFAFITFVFFIYVIFNIPLTPVPGKIIYN